MNLSVLIVEDEPDIRICLVEHFRHADFKIFTAENGEEGLDVLKEANEIDFVILDLKMPVLDGHRFLEQYRNFDKTKMKPVIIFSAERDAQELIGFAGVVAVFSKSSPLTLLVQYIKAFSICET